MKFQKQQKTVLDSSSKDSKRRLWSQVQLLTTLLILSGSLNIALMAFLIYQWGSQTSLTIDYDYRPMGIDYVHVPLVKGNQEYIGHLRSLPFDALIELLNDKASVESGYMKRDLALACLVNDHYLNLDKALSDKEIQRRTFPSFENEEGEDFTLFPALQDEDYEKIITFIQQERWPFTNRGLFFLLKRLGLEREPLLAETFTQSSEFLSLEALFIRSDMNFSRQELLSLILSGQWKLLDDFHQRQRKVQDFSAAQRQSLLLNYITLASQEASQLILKTDFDFVSRQLDDQRIMEVLNCLSEPTKESWALVSNLLRQPRSNQVWHKAASLLYAWKGLEGPQEFDYKKVMKEFFPGEEKNFEDREEFANEEGLEKELYVTHVVAEGDSLWRISKQYGVEIEKIKQMNALSSDFIKPGAPLKIPAQ